MPCRHSKQAEMLMTIWRIVFKIGELSNFLLIVKIIFYKCQKTEFDLFLIYVWEIVAEIDLSLILWDAVIPLRVSYVMKMLLLFLYQIVDYKGGRTLDDFVKFLESDGKVNQESTEGEEPAPEEEGEGVEGEEPEGEGDESEGAEEETDGTEATKDEL